MLIQNLISLASAWAGALLALTVGMSHRQLCALISFAAGTLLATTFLEIVPETVEYLPLIGISAALVSGYVVFYLISRFLFHVCPACAASHFEEQSKKTFRSIALVLFIAFAIHCAMDGIAIALGWELETRADRSIFLTVTIHKFPEGLALAALLLKAGLGRIRSLLTTVGLEAFTLVGWVAGFLFLQGFSLGAWFYLTLAHIGGGFIFLSLHAVLNETREHSPRYVVFFFLLGVAFIGILDLLPL